MSIPQSDIAIAGENSLLVTFDWEIDTRLAGKMLDVHQALQAWLGKSCLNSVITFNQIYVEYDLTVWSYRALSTQLTSFLRHNKISHSLQPQAALHTIPVDYKFGLSFDLATMAQSAGLSVELWIKLHSSATYTVMALGFAPGFAYLGGLPAKLHHPRRATPRPQIPAGAVAIADDMSAVYPQASPGGWNIIGTTAVAMFDDESLKQRFAVGDRVSFRDVSDIPNRTLV